MSCYVSRVKRVDWTLRKTNCTYIECLLILADVLLLLLEVLGVLVSVPLELELQLE